MYVYRVAPIPRHYSQVRHYSVHTKTEAYVALKDVPPAAAARVADDALAEQQQKTAKPGQSKLKHQYKLSSSAAAVGHHHHYQQQQRQRQLQPEKQQPQGQQQSQQQQQQLTAT